MKVKRADLCLEATDPEEMILYLKDPVFEPLLLPRAVGNIRIHQAGICVTFPRINGLRFTQGKRRITL